MIPMILRVCIFVLFGAVLNAQQAPTLRDPFAPPPHAASRVDKAFAAASLRAADLMPGFAVASAVLAFDALPVAFVRGWTAGGTGAGQVSYLAFMRQGRDSVGLVWSAPAMEYSSPPPTVRDKPYRLDACLFVSPDGELAYVAKHRPRERAFGQPPTQRDGYYRWSRARATFIFVRAVDSLLARRCDDVPPSDWKNSADHP